MLLTWLYVPGDRPERFAKAVASGADAVILDLEDGVPSGRKAYARDAVREFLSDACDVPAFVRINTLDDLFTAPGVAGWRLPKVESRAQVLAAAALTDAPLHCLIESAFGLEVVLDIARVAGVGAIGLGEEDLRSDLGLVGDEGLLWARSRIVVAARAAGLPPPAMSVYSDLSDLDGLRASCAQGRRHGFLGRTALHPKQLPAIVDGFRPPAEEVSRAQALLASVTEDSGALVLPDGRFADRALVAAAQRVVELDAHCQAAVRAG
ncbi:HpcH/HpaI aldolase/citrate lyase family protein [Allorhizocola rhizosphaerae]|uniref:HpcH/HpaI aldolase/citrate lyase family protein n=1 Tax=Allorhizocola rhizosphaerae TaxID=1872709 RepID=UPI000E3C46B4|nr:CoA ester lyase [Allorhizocola rhizosphaerae]